MAQVALARRQARVRLDTPKSRWYTVTTGGFGRMYQHSPHGPIVYWLGWNPFKVQNGVRFSVGLRTHMASMRLSAGIHVHRAHTPADGAAARLRTLLATVRFCPGVPPTKGNKVERYKRYATCKSCPKIGLPPRRIGWTGFQWEHIDTKFHWCVIPYVADPGV